MTKKTYIIYTWGYTNESGGVLVLHKLCDLLREAGEDAYIWPADKKFYACFSIFHRYWKKFRQWVQSRASVPFLLNPDLNTPIAPASKVKNAIVIYPEVISGNPLRSKHVVRWFLNKPGFFTNKINYGNNELYFFYQKIFNDPIINNNKNNELFILPDLITEYKQTNFSHREGTCFIVRKGKDRISSSENLQGEVIDGKSHSEIAEIFNKSEFCISYDSYTMFSAYASICGCKSIVVPTPGLTREQWQPDEELSYGIAYGLDDIDRAIQTKDKLVNKLNKTKKENIQSVLTFINKCESFFK